ncbi:hypothetical protein [Cytobacillus sp. IB215316]|uniref:hypothetical protein n=1 Tax=Cytobacillus sp. IB215316 TaxID=3097354 RepID=UPI002A0DDEB8|nr:hypothetical protein [Cytobacillus sp. IB215316]MDX8360176.1 hypothetical protein [Cytobacillus sp. IB215316]
MSQYKKVSTCCGSAIKEDKTCDCPCQLIVDDIQCSFDNLSSDNPIKEFYNGRAVGLHGNVVLNVSDPNDKVVFNFTSNGAVQSITLDNINPCKFFSLKNVTKVDVMFMGANGTTLDGFIDLHGMTESCS